MQTILQARPYGPDSTPEEVAAIRARMRLLEPGILIWQELPIQTVFSVRIAAEKLNELIETGKKAKELVDLREATSPSREVRNELGRLYKDHPKLTHIAIVTGKNYLMNVAARFISVLLGFGVKCTFHSTMEEALEALREEKNGSTKAR